jgi:uncharacterized membrane protein YphA (DoxX/SURF4 family)
MLSLFPTLLAYDGFTPFLLRLTLGAVLIFWSYKKLTNRIDIKVTLLGIIELISGILLIVGYLTQLAALIIAVILGIKIGFKIKNKSFLNDGVNYYLILFVISICILISGAGFIAFDLPL